MLLKPGCSQGKWEWRRWGKEQPRVVPGAREGLGEKVRAEHGFEGPRQLSKPGRAFQAEDQRKGLKKACAVEEQISDFPKLTQGRPSQPW